MIKNIQRTYFELWGEIEAQNKLLKGLLVFLTILCAFETIGLTALSLRKPFLIAISENSSKVLKNDGISENTLDAEIKRGISKFMTSHYHWEYGNLDNSLQNALNYVSSDYKKKFVNSNQEQIKIARDKKISQRFYIIEMKLDKNLKKVTVLADRVLILDSLKAVTSMNFDVGYELGVRSDKNPEGIYVTSETLLNNGN
jgi:hypothetical protein